MSTHDSILHPESRPVVFFKILRGISVLVTLIIVPLQYALLTRYAFKESITFDETLIKSLLVSFDIINLAQYLLNALLVRVTTNDGTVLATRVKIFKHFIKYSHITKIEASISV